MNYFTLLTPLGLTKVTNAQLTSNKVEITQIVVGDANGVAYTPTGTETAVKREVWRGGVASVEIDAQNPNWIVVESVIPASVGGFTLREVGLLDSAGDLIAIGNYPDTYKPLIADGSTMDLALRTIIEVSNASSVTLRVDPNVIVASRAYVDSRVNKLSTDLTSVTEQLAQAENYLAVLAVRPETFGAIGDNVADDRVAIQASIDYVANLGGGKVLLTNKYKVTLNGASGVLMRSNVILEFSPNAELNATTNNTVVYEIIRCFDINNFKILNGTLKGDKARSSAELGHGHGIGLYGVEDYHIDGVKIKDTTGDGILVGWIGTSKKVPKRGIIERFDIDGITRNGISIISCEDLVVRNGIIRNVYGSDPQSGIDVEPYSYDAGRIIGLRFKNIVTKNNKYGIIISCYAVSYVDVEIDDCTDEGSTTSSYVFINTSNLAQTGQIIARNLVSKNSRSGIGMDSYSSTAARLIIEKPKVFNYNPSSLPGIFSSGILISDTLNLLTNFGNIEIIEPYITTKQTQGSYCINIVGNKGRLISVKNPLKLENTAMPTRLLYSESGGNTKVTDNNKVLVSSLPDSDTTLSAFGYYSSVSTELMTAKRLITLSFDRPLGDTITINVLNTAGVQLMGSGGEYIYPLTPSSGNRIECTTLGGSITLKRVAQTGQSFPAWQIINQIGIWTVVE